MKKLVGFLSLVALVGVAASVYAFGIGNVTGSKVEKIAKDAGKMVVVSETNKKLAAKVSSCQCNQKTGTVSNCDFAGIKKTIDGARNGMKMALNRDATAHVYAPTQACATAISTQVTGWWYWNTHSGALAVKMQ